MKFLIDTNVIIPAEPTSPEDIEPQTPVIAELFQLLEEGGHQRYIHPASLDELQRDSNLARRGMRKLLSKKYPVLHSAPHVSPQLQSIIGPASPSTHDAIDHVLLAALEADAVDYLITHDQHLRKKAEHAGLHDRVMTAAEAVAAVRALFPVRLIPPPAVIEIPAYKLETDDPLFESLRTDYPGFDEWLRKCKREHRQSLIIRGIQSTYAGICILKNEKSGEYGLQGKVLKVCTFKVSEEYIGYRYGELLLKTVFNYSFKNAYDHLYVTVLPKYPDLVTFFTDFGFQLIQQKTPLGEVVLTKPLRFTLNEYKALEALDFNIRYGPHWIKLDNVRAFIIPIMPRYHRLLFPEAAPQLEIDQGQYPFGNSIKKAYLCHSPIRRIVPGSVLLFYSSQEDQVVQCIGVAEHTLVSSSANQLAHYVGKRTVYTFHAIEEMCKRAVLAILFRQARILDNPILLDELIANGVLKRAPQSIVSVRKGAMEWIRTRLER